MAKYGTFKYGHAKYGTNSALWICSRKQSDLDNNTDLAYINYWDLNRIETRIQELATLSGITSIETKTNWHKVTSVYDSANMPTSTQMQRIIGNIRTLCNLYELSEDIQDTMNYLDIYGMNKIEQVLYEIYITATNS